MAIVFIQPQDVLGRRIGQLGMAQTVNLAITTAGFIPIITCGDRTNPAVDLKKTVIAFIGFQNPSTAAGGAPTLTFGSSASGGTDWGTGLVAGANPMCFVMPQAFSAFLGGNGYAPGTVFGMTVSAAGVGTADLVAFGWSE